MLGFCFLKHPRIVPAVVEPQLGTAADQWLDHSAIKEPTTGTAVGGLLPFFFAVPKTWCISKSRVSSQPLPQAIVL